MAPALALATEKGDPDIMSRKPRLKHEPIINRSMAGVFSSRRSLRPGFTVGICLGIDLASGFG